MPQRGWFLALFVLLLIAAPAGADEPQAPAVAEGTGTVRVTDHLRFVPPEPSDAPESALQPTPDDTASDIVWYEFPDWLPPALASERRDVTTRFGWWYADQEGAKNKVGEWQSLESSPFADIDALFSNGEQTLDFTGSLLDNETNSGRLNFYSPKSTVKVEYDRFLHQLDHDPLYGTPMTAPPGGADNVVTDDLNLGEDYAIRVQELKTTVKGKLNDAVEWRVNLWGMRKTGERQSNAVAHCFDIDPGPASANKCHVLSQKQRIDWLTMEIEPVLAAKLENGTIEYSRTMRSFGQEDQVIDRSYTRPTWGYPTGVPYDYAIVPESFTYIDRLKLSYHLGEDNELYAYGYSGKTDNEYRDTERSFNGFDVRWTNTSIDNVSLTTYVKMTNEDNEYPRILFTEEERAQYAGSIVTPIDYSRTRVGVKGRWTPFADEGSSSDGEFDPWQHFAFTGGYEYYYLGRDHATYSSTRLGTFTQPDTKRHELQAGMAMPITQTFDSFLRYKGRFTEDPLIGVRESTGRFNTNQPEQEHGVDLGGSWNPAQNFMASAQFSIVNRWNYSSYPSVAPSNLPIHFSEDDYPIVCTVWYAPTSNLSFTGGYSYFSNWIEQDITIGFRGDPIESTEWNYRGDNHVVNFHTNYACTPKLKLNGGVDWNTGSNSFAVPPSYTGADWSQLASFSEVWVETMRYSAGIDYLWRDDMTLYFRYNYFDYEDKTEDIDSGTVHYLLAGISATY